MHLNTDAILEHSEESSRDGATILQDAERINYAPQFSLNQVDIEMWDHEGHETRKPFYCSRLSTDCLFQFAYYSNLGNLLAESTDRPFLTGSWKTTDLQSLSQGGIRANEFLFSTATVVTNRLVLNPDKLYPNTENFLNSDFAELETYLDSFPDACVGPLGKVLILRNKDDPQWGRLAKQTYKQCPQLAAVWMRILAANILNTESDKLASEYAAEIIKVFTYTLLHSGLFYFTKQDKTSNHSSLLFNFGVILDTAPVLRKLVLEMAASAISLFDRDSFDLFGLEAEVWNEPSLLDNILVYLSCELDRTCPVYQKAKYFMEHFVLSQTRNGKFGLVVADFYEFDSMQTKVESIPYQQKIMEFYTQGYQSGDEFICMNCLSRLAVIYERRWRKSLTNPALKTTVHIQPKAESEHGEPHPQEALCEEYNSILEVHRILARIGRYESMEFILNHYYKCYSYSSGELDNVQRPQRDIDNLIGNRKASLEMCKPYFNYFYAIGEKSPFLDDYFRLLQYLGYIEAGLVALRYGTVLQDNECTLAKRVYFYAKCKAEGLGIDYDPVYAGQVFFRIFLDEAERLSDDNLLDIVIQLYHLLKLEPVEQNEAESIRSLLFPEPIQPASKAEKSSGRAEKSKLDPLRNLVQGISKLIPKASQDPRLALVEELVNLISQSKLLESKQPSKKFLYYSIQILKEWKTLRPPAVRTDLQFEKTLVKLIQKSFFTTYQSNEDYYYQYLLEAEISRNIFSFQSMADLKQEKEYSVELNKFKLPDGQTDGAVLAETVQLLGELFAQVPKDKETEISKYHMQSRVRNKAQGVLKRLVGNSTFEQRPVQRGSTRTRSIVGAILLQDSSLHAAPARRVGAKKKLSLVGKKEMEMKVASNETLAMMTNLDSIGNQISVLSLMDEFRLRLVKETKLRLFTESELEDVDSEGLHECSVFSTVVAKKMRFSGNKQSCRVFIINLRNSQDCEDFIDSLPFATTWSSFFVNYFGIVIFEKPSSPSSFKIGLISEPFERLASSEGTSRNIWVDADVPIKDKALLFLDLLVAVRQLQIARIPHLMICPSVCAIYTCADNTRHLKLILPFFCSQWASPDQHLKDPSPLEDLVYLPPQIYVLKCYPSERPLPMKINPSDTRSQSQLNADAWSLAVAFVEMTQSASFLSSSGLNTPEELLNVMPNKSRLTEAIEEELSVWKKSFRSRRVPFHELQRMLSLKSQQRLSLSKTLEFLEMFVTREILGQNKTEEEVENSSKIFSPLTSALLRLAQAVAPTTMTSSKDGFSAVEMPQPQKDLRHNDDESGYVFLPLGLEYSGGLKFSEGRFHVLPHGRGVIRRGRKIILEGEFLSGLPSGQLLIHGEDAAQIELDIDEDKGVIKDCSVSWSDGKFEKSPIFEILAPVVRPGSQNQPKPLTDSESTTKMILADCEQILSLFQNTEKRKLLQADLKKHLELDKVKEQESNEDLMTNLGRMILGTIPVVNAEQQPKPLIAKEASSSIFDNFFKNEDWQDDEDQQNEDKLQKQESEMKTKLSSKSKLNFTKFGRTDVPLGQQSYENQYEMLKSYIDKLKEGMHMFCPPGYTLPENQRSKTQKKTKGPLNLTNMFNVVGTVLASPFAQEKEKKLVRSWDPFGFEYVFWQEDNEELPDPSLGLIRRSVGYENYLSTIVFLPSVSSFVFFETDIFRHRLVDCLSPINDLMRLSRAGQRSGYVVETDLTGEQRAVKIMDGRIFSGTAISIRTNKSFLYKQSKTADISIGSVYLKEEEFIYQGEIKSGMMNGLGSLRSAKNNDPQFYQGQFRDDLPHGKGVFTESTGEVFTGSFFNGVRVVGVLIGNKTNTREGLFIPKKQVETDLSPLRQAVRINQGSAIVVGRLSIPEKLTCFGVHQDTIAQATGFFKVKYPSGDQYQGYFNSGKRCGPFALTSSEGDTLVGKWLLQETDGATDKYSLQGIVLWNTASLRMFSIGIFKLNLRGDIEQGQYGVIKNRDGSIYRGEIYNNKYEGAGRLLFPDGSFYEGYFRDGLYHGWGEKYTKSTHVTFKGQFDHGIVQGFGILDYVVHGMPITIKGYFLDGICQIAYRENYPGKMDGKDIKSLVARTNHHKESDADLYEMDGVCRAVLGEGDYVFEGEIKNGTIEGKGILYKSEELVYEGSFKKGYFNVGRLVINPKVIFSGEFDRSSPINPGIKKDKDLVIEGTFQLMMNSDGRPDPISNSICLVYNKLLRELKVGYFKDGKEKDYFLVKKEQAKAIGENSASAGHQRNMSNMGRRTQADVGSKYSRNKPVLLPVGAPVYRLEYYNDGVLEQSDEFPPGTHFTL